MIACNNTLYFVVPVEKNITTMLFTEHKESLSRQQRRAVVVVSKLPVSGSTLQQPLKLAWPKPTACVAMVMSALLLR